MHPIRKLISDSLELIFSTLPLNFYFEYYNSLTWIETTGLSVTIDVSAWTWTVLTHRNLVLGLVLGFEGQVLGLGLGLAV